MLTDAWDLSVQIIKDGGHNAPIAESTLRLTVPAYHRSKLFLAPFVYAPDYPEPELKNAIDSCQALALGHARSHLQSAMLSSSDQVVRSKAEELLALVDQRATAMVDAISELAAVDPTVAEYYATLAVAQLADHPRQPDIEGLLRSLRNVAGFEAAKDAGRDWYATLDTTFVSGGSNCSYLSADRRSAVEQIAAATPPESLVGKMARDALELNTEPFGSCTPP